MCTPTDYFSEEFVIKNAVNRFPKKLTFHLFQMDRWIQMHYQMKERELALEISRSRELFYWLGSFYTVTLAGIVSRYGEFTQQQKER